MTQNFIKVAYKNYHYLFLLLIHVLIGLLVFEFPIIAKFFSYSILIIGSYFIIKNKNTNNEVLYISAYLVGFEVFLRMTNANPIYEFGKLGVVLFMMLGMFYKGVSKSAYPYFIFILLLIPSVIISVDALMDLKKKVAFDLSGPICLAICSLYMYKKKVSINEINSILLAIGLPIITISAYLFLASPITKINKACTESSFEMSGDYGPNQVATALGLGMFVFLYRTILNARNKKVVLLNSAIASYIFYRGLLTFSRGGMIVGIAMVVILLLFIFIYKKQYQTTFLKFKLLVLFLCFSSITVLTTYQTNGLLITRYANKNVLGSDNINVITGREALAKRDIKFFTKKPIFGIGVGEGKVKSKLEFGRTHVSHNEITRMLSEHGFLGIIAILILVILPFLLYLNNKQNVFLVVFIGFWFLTINHSAMRIAAPSFLYALALLNINFEKPSIE